MADNNLTHHHLKKQTRFLTFIVVVVLLILAAGEYYLFRKELALNKMVSEGIFQLKQEIKSNNALQMQKIEQLVKPAKR